MLPEEAIVARLLRPGAATKPLIDGRIFPDYWPEAQTPPGIVYERKPNAEYDYTHFGSLENVRCHWHLHIYTEQEDKLAALQIGQAIRRDLHNYRAALEGLNIRYILVMDEFDGYDGQAKRPRRTVDIEVLYEPIPT